MCEWERLYLVLSLPPWFYLVFVVTSVGGSYDMINLLFVVFFSSSLFLGEAGAGAGGRVHV